LLTYIVHLLDKYSKNSTKRTVNTSRCSRLLCQLAHYTVFICTDLTFRCTLLPVYVYLSNAETTLQVSSNWRFSSVEQNSALRHGVKRDWSRCACTLVFLRQRGNHLTDTWTIFTNIARNSPIFQLTVRLRWK